MNRLVFAKGQLQELRHTLLAAAPDESAAAIITAPGAHAAGIRLIVQEIIYPSDTDYLERGPLVASLKPEFIARVLKRARVGGAGLILAHSHPFQADVHFSKRDDAAQRTLASTLHARAPGPHGFLVIGAGGFEARLFDHLGNTTATVGVIQDVGSTVVRTASSADNEDGALPAFLDRNIRAFGSEGQRMLSQLRVGVVGVGGTGSVVVEELARLGVGELLVIDPEEVEATNLNRLIGSTRRDVGRPKVDVAAESAARARPGIAVTRIAGSIIEERVARTLLDCDFVMCCTDSHGSRAVLNQLAYQYRIPMIDVGVRIDAKDSAVVAMSTRVQMLAEGLACLNCHPLLDPVAIRRDLLRDLSTDRYIVGAPEPQPAVISLNAATSSSAVSMMLSATIGFPGNARHLIGRPIEGIVRPILSEPNPSCIVCASENALAKGDLWPMIWLRDEG